ncbi:tyrosine-protein phosphatase [Lichenicoccus sp.]|uniref:tyrosine-protein phosphatase n=1 Tax=Lichenicoccus sp. TaxID=2781899 RepID=UPI003D0CB687
MRDVEQYDFERIDNLRDFGGVASLHGGRVLAGRLFRSAHLGDASSADIAGLERLGIAIVTDLRRTTERRRQPSRWQAFTGRLICSDTGDRAEGPHVEFLRQGDFSDAGVAAYLSGYYRQAPFEPRHLAMFAETFAALQEIDGALLVHCAAGKDRTGLLAALIQRALGVHTDDVMADFLATNAVMMTPARRQQVAESLAPIVGGAPSEAILRGFMGVSTGHLQIAFAAIDAQAGSLDAYFARIGMGAAQRDGLGARLLV